jgi:hypothetical protein
MMDYNPTTYLVRVLYKMDGVGVTMDTTANDVMQQTVAAMVESVGNVFLKAYEINQPSEKVYFEVLTGATANQISRREDLLNAARNLLIECEAMIGSKQMEKVILNMVDEIGEEIGIAQ